MNHPISLRTIAVLVGAPALAVCLFAQSAADTTLVVNGRIVRSAVREIDGRPYVDIELLAQALGASINFESHRISFNLPTAQPAASGAPAAVPAANSQRLSPEFAAAAISALTAMRQWQGAMETVITFGVPVVGTWPQDYRNNAEAGLVQARAASSTNGDQSVLQLLQGEFASLSSWSNSVVAERQSLHAARFVDPNALKNDPALSKISNCSRSLGAMIGSGVSSDGSDCH